MKISTHLWLMMVPVLLTGAVACRSSKKSKPTYSYEKKHHPQKSESKKTNTKAVVKEAERYLGVGYKFGGTDRRGMDCSGLTFVCFKDAAGITLPRTSYDQATLGRSVRRNDAEPGDLIFFKGSDIKSSKVGHVGIVVENTGKELKFIHTASTGVRYDYLERNSYYKPRFLAIRRID